MIRSIQSGRKYYSMGRTSLENTGLLRFKRSWGTIEEFLTTLSYPPANSGTVTLPFFRALEQIVRFGIRSLPLPFARLLGAFIYSHWA